MSEKTIIQIQTGREEVGGIANYISLLISSEKNNFISRIVPFFYKNILAKKKNLLFYDFKKRKFPQRSYMHVNDISKINIDVINNFKRFNKNFYIFNVSNRKQYSNFQVLKELSKLMNVNPKYEIKTLLNNDCIKVLNSNRPNIIGLKKITSETPKIKKMYLKRINELKK